MTDFIFSTTPQPTGYLAATIKNIYLDGAPEVHEFRGDWGVLAVSDSLYNGFNVVDNESYLFLIIGAPVLTFCENYFLKESSSAQATELVFNRFLNGTIDWSNDLSGPFAVFSLNKSSREVALITDLMSFIPLYKHKVSNGLFIGSYADGVAKASGQIIYDDVSQADFLINGFVTFPFTIFKDVYQLNPASIYKINLDVGDIDYNYYWTPNEIHITDNIDIAATTLRNSLHQYISIVTESVNSLSLFLSGGEDSRAVLSLIGEDVKKDAYSFLDSYNIEGRIAKKAARYYNATFKYVERERDYYLNILPKASSLVGAGAQYHHVHPTLLVESCGLKNYNAVFGGFFADALFKGARIKQVLKSHKFPTLYQRKNKNYNVSDKLSFDLIDTSILALVDVRRKERLDIVRTYRPSSCDEWFELWPATMNLNHPCFSGNRRLFCSYEPFMAAEVVKLSASIPQEWKLNRRIYQKAVKPLFAQHKFLLHTNGWLPYFAWYYNAPVYLFNWLTKTIAIKLGIIDQNQGSWWQWQALWTSDLWKNYYDIMRNNFVEVSGMFKDADFEKVFNSLDNVQKLNLLQALYSINKRKKEI
jgi:asparagine synthetase B (glutamine-hydrolysing)